MPAKQLIAVVVMLLVGCASSPRNVILHPQYQGNSSNQLPLSIALQVNDLRTTKYTIRVEDRSRTLYAGCQPAAKLSRRYAASTGRARRRSFRAMPQHN